MIGFAPQALGIYPRVTVREGLWFFGRLVGLDRRTLRQRLDDVSRALALDHLLDRKGGRCRAANNDGYM